MTERNREFVESLYRIILRREGDEAGVASASQALSMASDRDSIALGLIQSLLASDEYLNRISSDTNVITRIVNPAQKNRINGLPAKHIISLGTHCLTSSIMKNLGMRRYSLPFDWIFTSPQTVAHCLNDGFKTFLDQSHYRTITRDRGTTDPGADHLFYLNKHEDAKLFVMIERVRVRPPWIFRSLSRAINRLTENSAFLYIEMKKPTMLPGIRSVKLRKKIGEHRAYEFTPSSREHGTRFDDPMDDLSIIQIINQYEMDIN